MSRFRNVENNVTISVDDSKDERYAASGLWVPADAPADAPAKKSPAKPEK